MEIFEAARAIANILKEAGKIEEYKQILELIEKILELKKKNFDLENENKNLKEKFEIKEKLEYKHNSYWLGEDGPFCSRCWDKNRELIRMNHGVDDNYAHCQECKNNVNFTGREHKFPDIHYED